MSTTPTSEASTKVEVEIEVDIEDEAIGDAKTASPTMVYQTQASSTSRDILIFLVAFRVLNALCVRTFFQPDEYFQSLEPAWEIAFGKDAGAWITWEWRSHLRSTIHPYLFAVAYRLADSLANVLRLSPHNRAELLVATPKVLQAHIAAVGDYYTWKLGEKIYGHDTLQAWASIALTVCSPWQWFCSTRTLSNCLETTLTIVALHLWPWEWSLDSKSKYAQVDTTEQDGTEELVQDPGPTLQSLRGCLLLAAIACVLRPTNILIWFTLSCFMLFRVLRKQTFIQPRWPPISILTTITWPALRCDNRLAQLAIFIQATFCGAAVLAVSGALDWVYYQQLTFPPLKFLYFNVVQSLSVFYGRNPWHYYLSQGLPLLLTSYLPFAVHGLYRALLGLQVSVNSSIAASNLPSSICHQLAWISIVVPSILSLISHKEVRFIYPLLPILHVLAAPSAVSFFRPALQQPRRPLPITPMSSAPSSPLLSKSFLSSAPSSPSSSRLLNPSPTSSPKSSRILNSAPSSPNPKSNSTNRRTSSTSSPQISKLLPSPEITSLSSSSDPQSPPSLSTSYSSLPSLPSFPPALPSLPSTLSTLSSLLPTPLPIPLPKQTHTSSPTRLSLLILLLAFNTLLAILVTTSHQPAPLSLLSYLRHEHETLYLTQPPAASRLDHADTTMTLGFLMPCHSTPWRSHLIHPGIKAWALGCEPPLHLSPGPKREEYLDEADLFYEDPKEWMEGNLYPLVGKPKGRGDRRVFRGYEAVVEGGGAWHGGEGKKTWPEYLVFFEGLEGVVREVSEKGGLGYGSCWRGWNSWGHDDWRRRGDVVVWCLRGGQGGGNGKGKGRGRGGVGEGAVRIA